MKTIMMSVALMIAVASMSVNAQSGGNNNKTAVKYPVPTAQGPSNKTTGARSTQSQSGSASVGKQSDGTASGQRSAKKSNQSGPKNQEAAGVAKSGSASNSRTGKPANQP